MSPIHPVKLKLFDGSSNSFITEVTTIPIIFPTSECISINFYVTLLNSSISVVLGYNWLTCYNLLIDWILKNIIFCSTAFNILFLSLISSTKDTLPQHSIALSVVQAQILLSISLINAAAFMHATKLEGSQSFYLQLNLSNSISAHSFSLAEEEIDLSNVPSDYYEFADVFSKDKADRLTPYHSYNLKINLVNDAAPLIGYMYSVSQSELKSLHEFIDEHLSISFICPLRFLYRAPILFICKKDSSLHLCINFRGLNSVTKKDHYPLLLISDLLDSSHYACIYSKINLCHAYHLVHIAEGDK